MQSRMNGFNQKCQTSLSWYLDSKT